MNDLLEILNQIAANTKPNNRIIWVTAISSFSTLLGAAIGAYLLYRGTAKNAQEARRTEEKKLYGLMKNSQMF